MLVRCVFFSGRSLYCTSLFVSWLVVSTLLEALWTSLGGKGGNDAPLYALAEDNEYSMLDNVVIDTDVKD